MISLSPEEKEAVFNWGKNELVKSLKSEAAFCIFNEIINGGEFDINALSRKLAFKLGTKNGLRQESAKVKLMDDEDGAGHRANSSSALGASVDARVLLSSRSNLVL